MADAPAPPEPWYAAGLTFGCTACGKCCTGVPGYVWVTPEEIARLARFKGQSVERFSREHVRRVGKRLSLIERKNGDCVLLRDGKCTVYPVKPTPCSTFPFWDGPLSSPEAWQETAARCEGIGRGALYSREEIERVHAGDAGPLLAKHAAAAAAPPTLHPADGASASPGALPPLPERMEAALADLERLYAELDSELPRYRFTCAASGACCDFDAYGHRLYASTLEAEWFFRHAPAGRANDDPRHCPAWGADRLCKARTGRMLGCRTYFCGPYPAGLPQDVHEPFHARVKALHERHGIPYAYRDVLAWSAERRPAPPARPAPDR